MAGGEFSMACVYVAQYLRSLGGGLDVMQPRVGQIGVRGAWWALPQSLALLAKFIAAPIIGTLADVLGSCVLLVALYLGLAVINALAFLADEYWHFVVLRTALGVHWMCTPLLLMYVSSHAHDQSSHAQTVARIRGFRTMAMLTAPFIFGWLRTLEMRYSFAVASVVLLLNSAVPAFFFAHKPAQGGRDSKPVVHAQPPVNTIKRDSSSLTQQVSNALSQHLSMCGSSMATALSHPVMTSSFLLAFVRPTLILGPYARQTFRSTPEQISWLAAAQSASSLAVAFTPLLPTLLRRARSVKTVLVSAHLATAVLSAVALLADTIPRLAAALFVRAVALGLVKACEQVMWADVDSAVAARDKRSDKGKLQGESKRGDKPELQGESKRGDKPELQGESKCGDKPELQGESKRGDMSESEREDDSEPQRESRPETGSRRHMPESKRRRRGFGGAMGRRAALSTVGGSVAALFSGYLASIDARLLFVGMATVSALDAATVYLLWRPSPDVDLPHAAASTASTVQCIAEPTTAPLPPAVPPRQHKTTHVASSASSTLRRRK